MSGKPVKLGSLKKGEYFTICDHDGEEINDPSIIWVRDEYDHSTRKFICRHFDDIGSSRQWKADTRVYVDFIF